MDSNLGAQLISSELGAPGRWQLQYRVDPQVIEEALTGCGFIERTARGVAPCHLPAWARVRSGSLWLDALARCATGVTLRFVSAASRLQLELIFSRFAFEGVIEPARLVVEAGGRRDVVDLAAGDGLVQYEAVPGDPAAVSPTVVQVALGTAQEEREITVRLPQAAAVEILAVHSDAPMLAATPALRPRWLHHGSSISHCSYLPDPEAPWPHRVATDLGLNLVNASFSGNAILDPFVADALSELEFDVATFEVGINVVNWDSHIARSFVPALHGFLDRFRQRNRDLPIGVVTPFFCGFHEHRGGPIEVGADGRLRAASQPRPDALTLSQTRHLIQTVVEVRRDPLLCLVDGLAILGERDAHLLMDGLHPGANGVREIATRFAASARDPRTPLGRTFAGVVK